MAFEHRVSGKTIQGPNNGGARRREEGNLDLSKRLQLHHLQLIAKGLDLPSAASASDLFVMISGKLYESNHDPSNTQVIIAQSVEGEVLSLQDVSGVFLKVPVFECTSS